MQHKLGDEVSLVLRINGDYRGYLGEGRLDTRYTTVGEDPFSDFEWLILQTEDGRIWFTENQVVDETNTTIWIDLGIEPAPNIVHRLDNA